MNTTKGAEDIYTEANHDPASKAWENYVRKWQKTYGGKAYPRAYTQNYYQLVYYIREVYEKADPKDWDTINDIMHETSYKNVCYYATGPFSKYSWNKSVKGIIVHFASGSLELAPDFGLHPELEAVYEPLDMTLPEMVDLVKRMEIPK